MSDKRPLLPPGDELRRKTARVPGFIWVIAPIICAAVLLCAIIAFREPAAVETDSKAAVTSAYTFSDIALKDAGAVTRAEITIGGDAWALRTEGDALILEGENELPASGNAKAVLSCGTSIMSRMELTGDKADFGLDSPDVRAVFTYENGQRLELLIGNPTSGGNGRYASVSGSDKIYIVGEALYKTLTVPKEKLYKVPDISGYFTADTIMELSVSPVGREAVSIRRVTESNPHNTVAEFTRPLHYPCNSTRTGELFLSVAALQPEGILSAGGTASEVNALAYIRVAYENGEITLVVGEMRERPVLLIGDSDIVYLLKDGALDFIDRAAVAWLAEQTPGLVMLNQVKTLTVTCGDEMHVLKPEADTYLIDGGTVSRDEFVSVYKQCIGFLIERYESGAVWDAAAETARFEYLLVDGSVFTVAFEPYDETYCLIRREDDAHFLISRSRAEAVLEAVRRAGKQT